MALQEAFVAALPATLAVMERAHAAARAAAAWVVQVRHTHPRAGMYPLDLSVAAGAQRAQFLRWAFPMGTQIQKPSGYDGASHSGCRTQKL